MTKIVHVAVVGCLITSERAVQRKGGHSEASRKDWFVRPQYAEDFVSGHSVCHGKRDPGSSGYLRALPQQRLSQAGYEGFEFAFVQVEGVDAQLVWVVDVVEIDGRVAGR